MALRATGNGKPKKNVKSAVPAASFIPKLPGLSGTNDRRITREFIRNTANMVTSAPAAISATYVAMCVINQFTNSAKISKIMIRPFPYNDLAELLVLFK